MELSDEELDVKCMKVLIDKVGLVDAARFVFNINRKHLDYTSWRAMQPDSDETMEELGRKLMAFDQQQGRSTGYTK